MTPHIPYSYAERKYQQLFGVAVSNLNANTETSAILSAIKGKNKPFQWYALDDNMLRDLGIDEAEKTIYIFSDNTFPRKSVQGYMMSFHKQKNPITDETVPYLQLIDIVFIFKKMTQPDLQKVFARYQVQISQLSYEEQKTLARLVRKYPAFVRFVLAIVFRLIKKNNLSEKITQTLSPASYLRLCNEWKWCLQ